MLIPPEQKANLARIRDNQRRSRARRKEYLQELETKYRQCEQIGVEASSEMQVAARKVLEENRKLRTLLKSKGMSDQEIESHMGEEDAPTSTLNAVLQTRKPCCPGGEDSCDTNTPTRSPGLMVHLQDHPTHSTELYSPSYDTSQGVSPNIAPNMGFPAYHQQPPIQSPYDATGLQGAPAFSTMYDVEPNWYPQDARRIPSQVTPSDGANTSCVDAANIIRTMGADVGTELEADLGCQPGKINCKVENSAVFDVMEKYSMPCATNSWQPLGS